MAGTRLRLAAAAAAALLLLLAAVAAPLAEAKRDRHPSRLGAACSGVPGDDPPNTAGWECADGRGSGLMCSARCAEGFTGGFRARCKHGRWGKAVGKCTPSVQATVAAAAAATCGPDTSCYPDWLKCVAPPPGGRPAANSTDWPVDRLEYQDGEALVAPCRPGFKGAIVSTCRAGTWTAPAGACWADLSVCPGTPATRPGANALDWPGNRPPYQEGEVMWADCKPGFVGRIGSVCGAGGRWSTVFGFCVKSPFECRGPPTFSPGNNTNDWPQYNGAYGDGDYISTTCISGGYYGSVRAVCQRGVWVGPVGSCYRGNGTAVRCVRRPAVARPVGASGWQASDCNFNEGGFCRARCKGGYTGSLLSFCQGGIWSNVTGTCNRPPVCKKQPAAISPNSTGWDSCNTAHGSVCVASCREGFSGAPVAVCGTATTANGSWSAVVGVPCALSTSVCSSSTPATVPTNAFGWDPANCDAREGGTCFAKCAAGFTGSPFAQCRSGRWGTTLGSCVASVSVCPRHPTSVPVNSDGWLACDRTEGGNCYADCSDGYVGAPVSTCRGGKWGLVSGACYPDTSECPGIPETTPANSDGWLYDSCPTVEGSVCVGDCRTGFAGRPTTICKNGVWGATLGTCYRPANASRVCTSAPAVSPGPNAVPYDAVCAGTLEGGVCEAPCLDGYVGRVWTTCINGTWQPTLGSCYKDAHVCDGPPDLPRASNDTLPWPAPTYSNGQLVSTGCKPNFVGSYSAECLGTTFGPATGQCSAFNQAASACWPDDLPPAASAGADSWACLASVLPDGDACTASCPAGTVGTPWTLCSNGAWGPVQGACRPDTSVCSTSLLDATVQWDYPCGGPSAAAFVSEGEACSAPCADGYDGTVTVLCANGTFGPAVTTCAPRTLGCSTSTLPAPSSFGGAAWADADWPCSFSGYWVSEGGSCAATCPDGQLGQLELVCKSGEWQTPAQGSCRADASRCLLSALPSAASLGAAYWKDQCSPYYAGEGGSVAEGQACYGLCQGAVSGSPSARCRGGAWVLEQPACVPAYNTTCLRSNLPALPAGAVSWGACVAQADVPEGTVCLATCNGTTLGAPMTTCRNGVFSAPSGLCFARPAAPRVCAGLPTTGPPSSNATDWAPECAGAGEGVACVAGCKQGYNGAIVSVCRAGVWGARIGSCFRSAYYCRPPTGLVPGSNNSLEFPTDLNYLGSYYDFYDGDMLSVACKDGYVGSLDAVCRLGRFTNATGACYLDPNVCRGPPTSFPGNNSGPWPAGAYDYPDGAVISTECLPGWVGPGVKAICQAGAWGAPYGGCWRHTRTCFGMPPQAPGPDAQDWPDARPSFLDGEVISAACISGYVGGVYAQCRNGAWSTPAGGCAPDPHICTALPTGRPAADALDWPGRGLFAGTWADGQALKAGCKAGALGAAVAVCQLGQWAPVNEVC